MSKRKFKRALREKTPAPVHVYPEAFKLMQYQCEQCGKIEWLWNSRNGVTPFKIKSRCCGYFASHIHWQQDVFAPGHKPNPGDRIFAGEAEKPKVVVFA